MTKKDREILLDIIEATRLTDWQMILQLAWDLINEHERFKENENGLG